MAKETLYAVMGREDAILHDLYSSHTYSAHRYEVVNRVFLERAGTHSKGPKCFLAELVLLHILVSKNS